MITTMAATWTDGHWHGGPGPWVAVWGLFWVGLVTAFVVLWLTRWRHHGATSGGRRLLAERYARGEIDDAEYESRLRVLRHRS